jgi:hypothetical protein
VSPAKKRRQRAQTKATKRRRGPSPIFEDAGEHAVPKPLAERLLADFLVVRPEHQERMIREYVEIQGRPAKVRHLEKVKTERVGGRALDVWDVRTTLGRYWVITDPTNLYSQRDFPSSHSPFTSGWPRVCLPGKKLRFPMRSTTGSSRRGEDWSRRSRRLTMPTRPRTSRRSGCAVVSACLTSSPRQRNQRCWRMVSSLRSRGTSRSGVRSSPTQSPVDQARKEFVTTSRRSPSKRGRW